MTTSQDDLDAYLKHMTEPDNVRASNLGEDSSIADVLGHAASLGHTITEDQIRGMLKERLHLAQSLPKGWGWPLAREMNLVRK